MKTTLLCAALSALTLGVHAAPISLHLPRPDGKPADQTKPVKVYILAGQSNMVGMGDITGAQPPHPRVYLSADPAIIPGSMPVGTGRAKSACRWIWRGSPALEKHGVYQNAAGNEAGAKIAIYEVSWDANAKPIKTTTVPLGLQSAEIPKMGTRPTYATAFIDVPVTGNYLVHVGFGDSTQAIATVNGTEVYRKDSSAKSTLTKITLEADKRHPLRVTYLKGGSAAFWLEQVDLVGKSDLVTLTKKDGKFPYLLDDKGEWSVRNDVYFQEARVAEEGKGSPLSATSNGKSIGPEVGFGFVMGTRDFWREVEESPRGQDYHYNRNLETYLLVGEAMGRAMVRLLGGEAEAIPKSDREQKTMAAMALEAATPAPTAEQIAASNAAVKPMILNGALEFFLADSRNQTALKAVLSPALPMPAKAPEYLEDAIDDAVSFMQAAGNSDHDWKPVLADMRTGKWDVFGFNIPDSPYKNKSTASGTDQAEEGAETASAPKGKKAPAPPALKITPPSGMENWFDPSFDTKKAAWKSAAAPFGVAMDENVPEAMSWIANYPIYPLKRPMPNTVVDNDVLLMRGTFELPPRQARPPLPHPPGASRARVAVTSGRNLAMTSRAARSPSPWLTSR